MLKHKDHFHGSDLEKIESIYHIKREDIISFSANVNPLGISYHLKNTLANQLDAITSYPDREYTKLRRCIAEYADSQLENIIVGNGSTELISLFIQTQHPKKAMILGPTYSEYEREITLGGGTTNYYPLRECDSFHLDAGDFCRHLNDSIDLLVLCNPNNPTSTSINRDEMRLILDTCLQYGIFVMVDETYVEFAPKEARVSAVPLTNYYNNLIILRGTSKFFAAPGLRLGYAVTGNQDVCKAINTRKNPWTINSLAEIAGRLMFCDNEYVLQTQQLISSERTRLFEELSSWDTVKVYQPSANFMLMQILKDGVTSDELFDHCIRKCMMIRDCSTFPFLNDKYVRFCIMHPEQNDRLLEAFCEILQ
ncbi:aminotransferase class I/II-fold pyridoxal phosphate-dependent enzyme [Ruminococcus sp. OA3]|uniref:pyridoxal phosphate-dependent aminotransferase n=1 Tax=Ruminococcus sp. OA3 TaxID=2914164 RepID=UPI001F0644B2|nr:histidinol-phosphate transaminase [Ruminococcus sp. OA3]MCH1982820.1 aminotransferase class I/II-fold pyridoxal phosphate-dependent enzyme [Ruminococcus sp. OA3]